MTGWLAVPRDWLASFGDIARFCARVLGIVYIVVAEAALLLALAFAYVSRSSR
jgi:hypothetical protein